MLKFLTIFIAAAITLIGCEQSSFEGSAPSLPTPVKPEPVTPTEPGLFTEFFIASPEPQQKSKVDVLFLLDTSGSMEEEKDAVEIRLQEFISNLDDSLDYHVYVVGSEIGYTDLFPNYIPFDINLGELSDSERVTKINEPIDSFNALQVFHDLITDEDSPLNLRENASLEVVVVSDDNPITVEESNRNLDFGYPAYKELFVNEEIKYPMQSGELIEVLEEKFADKTIHFNAFVGLETSIETEECQVVTVGQDYIDIAVLEKYKGFIGDICSESEEWTTNFKEHSKTIIEQNSAQKYGLKQAPTEEKRLKLYINDKLIDEEKYTILGTEIIFDQLFEPSEGDKIKIDYFIL